MLFIKKKLFRPFNKTLCEAAKVSNMFEVDNDKVYFTFNYLKSFVKCSFFVKHARRSGKKFYIVPFQEMETEEDLLERLKKKVDKWL